MTLFFYLIDAYDNGEWRLVPLCIKAEDIFSATCLANAAVFENNYYCMNRSINYCMGDARLCGVADKAERV